MKHKQSQIKFGAHYLLYVQTFLSLPLFLYGCKYVSILYVYIIIYIYTHFVLFLFYGSSEVELPPSDYGVLIDELEATSSAVAFRYRQLRQLLTILGFLKSWPYAKFCSLHMFEHVAFEFEHDQGSARSLVLQPQEGFIKKCRTGSFSVILRFHMLPVSHMITYCNKLLS